MKDDEERTKIFQLHLELFLHCTTRNINVKKRKRKNVKTTLICLGYSINSGYKIYSQYKYILSKQVGIILSLAGDGISKKFLGRPDKKPG